MCIRRERRHPSCLTAVQKPGLISQGPGDADHELPSFQTNSTSPITNRQIPICLLDQHRGRGGGGPLTARVPRPGPWPPENDQDRERAQSGGIPDAALQPGLPTPLMPDSHHHQVEILGQYLNPSSRTFHLKSSSKVYPPHMLLLLKISQLILTNTPFLKTR